MICHVLMTGYLKYRPKEINSFNTLYRAARLLLMIIEPQRYRISFTLSTLFYPFAYPNILTSLANRDYIISTQPPMPLPNGARVYVSGYIASKYGCFIELNDSRKLIASEGTSLDGVIAAARDIIDIAERDLHLNISKDIDFCELVGAIIISDDNNSLEAVKKFSGDSYKIFDEILGVDSAGFSIRIIPRNGTPVERTWFDITITPRLLNVDQGYYVEVVFRDGSNVDNVLGFALQLPKTISELIGKIGSL